VPEIARKGKAAPAGIAGLLLAEKFPRVVPRAVIHANDLEWHPPRFRRGREAGKQQRQNRFLIEAWRDNRYRFHSDCSV
jgi:hypothetical protein